MIFMHNYPDPDSITSALLLKKIASKFQVKSKIVYRGEVTREENLAMIEHLKLKLFWFEEKDLKHPQILGAVDFQYENTNHSIPENYYPQVTFDHHSYVKSEFKKKNFFEINSKMGSTSTILLDYFFHFGLKLDKVLATCYVYTILTETSNFNRSYTPKDVFYYRKCLQLADFAIIAKIESTPKKPYFFDVMKIALNNYVVKNQILFCPLGEINNLELIQEVAEFFIKREKVMFSVVTGTVKGQGKICTRSKEGKVHLGEITKKSLAGLGSGGGHSMMAAGNFQGQEKVVINRVIKEITQQLS